ncbi:hypothetical protein OIU79_011609 [Salix purpurea]|uniref:Pentatricopeptide repeat-containing protein n=1 Tax=Salix purpurea TaxID=77065 RepID=A0A9Q0T2C7_SALPP|nr:hypothetical protein OIU79_011609 [Salix purpurea]
MILPRNLISLSQTKQAHARIIVSGLAGKASLMGHLLSFLAIFPSSPFDYSLSIYRTIKNPNVFSSNNMIRCFAKSESPLQSLVLYSCVLRNCVRPNNYSFTFLLQACSKGLGLYEGVQVHGHVLKLGFGEDVYVRNALIHLYSSCRRVESSKQVFDESPHHCDVVTWNVMLAGFARDGRVSAVENLFDEMPERDVISWNTLLMAYVHNGKLEEALECFKRMRESGLVPDEATLVIMLSASAQLSLLENGQSIHSIIDSLNLPMTISIGTALVDMYAKCGRIEQSRLLFENMPRRDVSTWNVMICGLASHGLGKDALTLFKTKWEDVARVRRLMTERNTSKVAGWSLIEAQGKVHRFVAGDREHEQSLEIQKMLEVIDTRLAAAGYVPNISPVFAGSFQHYSLCGRCNVAGPDSGKIVKLQTH